MDREHRRRWEHLLLLNPTLRTGFTPRYVSLAPHPSWLRIRQFPTGDRRIAVLAEADAPRTRRATFISMGPAGTGTRTRCIRSN